MKRGGPLKRSGPLKRAPMKRRRKVRPSHLRDDRFLAFVRSLPCCVCHAKPPSDPHHRTGAGLALKAHDRETMPLCRRDHRDLDEFRGRFRGWTREQRATWQDARIAEVQALYAMRAAS